MKKSGLFIVLVFLLLFSGCANIKISYSISPENTVQTAYSVQIDKNKLRKDQIPYSNYIDSVKAYWQQQGMQTTLNEDENYITLTGSKEIHAASKKDAFDKLKEILTGKYSPFATLDFQFAESYLQDTYSLAGSMDLTNVLRKETGENIPKDLLEEIKSEVKDSSVSVQISLPGTLRQSDGDTKADQKGLCTGVWNIQYGEKKSIGLQTVQKNLANIKQYQKLQDEKNQYQVVIIISGFMAAVSLCVVVIWLLRRKRKIQTGKANQKDML